MKTEWSHLPNAEHIDRVLASLKAHPEVWGAARDRDHSDAARDAAWYAAGYAAWYAARDAIAALVAWDNSAKFLDMTPNELKMWGALSEDPAAILLLPAVRAFDQLKELELVDS